MTLMHPAIPSRRIVCRAGAVLLLTCQHSGSIPAQQLLMRAQAGSPGDNSHCPGQIQELDAPLVLQPPVLSFQVIWRRDAGTGCWFGSGFFSSVPSKIMTALTGDHCCFSMASGHLTVIGNKLSKRWLLKLTTCL